MPSTPSRPRSAAAPAAAAARAAFTELVLEVFRLNGALLAAGNALCEGTKLTSARWQVLGAIALAAAPPTASQIARAMGLTRQAVQRLVDELEGGGLVRRVEHPESRRARPVQLTERGAALYAEMTRRQAPWAAATARGITRERLEAAREVLRTLRGRLEARPTP
jgi:DNA-binding MarR family transcriptional regulator